MTEPPVADVLLRIVERRRARLGVDAPPWDREVVAPFDRKRQSFLAAIDQSRGSAIVAEIKMGSPRLGPLGSRVDPERQARLYRDGGAAALSVVVEPDYFYGDYGLLEACKAASGLPALAKDFVVSRRQLDDARAAGANAILLIAALYTASELRAWANAARARGLVPLVETHSPSDVEKLGDTPSEAPWELVGVNNRNLRTFEVDLENSIELRPSLPAAALAVAESGIASGEDRARLAAAGFDAFLIGEALLLAEDPAEKLAELISG